MKYEDLFNQLVDKAQGYLDFSSVKKIKHVLEFAKQAHEGQFRKSTRPFIIHPMHVAIILCDLEQDVYTVMAGILHDTIEDTEVTYEDIEHEFGKTVAKLVLGVTKLSKLKFHSKQEAQAENYRKMFLSMAEDYRVIIIKLADRLHNMKTLNFLANHKQQRIAQETLDIYAPLANKLGIAMVKWQLEDLAFSYLNYEKYQEIKDLVELSRSQREAYIQAIIARVKKLLLKSGIKANISGRPKHLYSIFSKLDKKNSSIDEIYDLLGLRILVEDVAQCYGSLGAIHTHFKPVPNRFKDYIALPKSNGYQSLHTTVITDEGKPLEIQIRTSTMHHTSEFGFAAHWHYKKGGKSKSIKGELGWLQEIIDHNEEGLAPVDFLQTLKMDLYADEVFVFTPKGDLKVLSRGSTVLDFAYSIHTEVGNTCKGALVNGKIVPLHYELKSGDQAEILTSKTAEPKVDWLRMVHSRHSRYNIKQFLNSKKKTDLLEAGQQRLKRAFFSEGLIFDHYIKMIDMNSIKERFQVSKIEDLFVFIEQGDVSTKEIVRFVKRQLDKKIEPELKINKSKVSSNSSSSGIYVLGESNVKFTLAKCCMPIPGDEISGLIVLGKGVSVHRSDCRNLIAVKEKTPERILDVQWDSTDSKQRMYLCTFRIEGYDREGLLQDLLSIIYNAKVNLREVRTKVNSDNMRMSATLSVDLINVKQFYELKRRLTSIDDVYSVVRVSLGLES